MKHYMRKLWFYTFMCGMLVLTTITTTYAYYAINYVNEQEEFEFDIESGDELLISTDGINFKKELSEVEVKEAVLSKQGIDTSNLTDDEILESFKIILDDCTPVDLNDLDKGFMSIKGESITPSNYIGLDLYLSSNVTESGGIPYGMPVFLDKNTRLLADDFETDLSHYELGETVLGELNNPIKLNLENACRLSVTTYDRCVIGDLENSSNNPNTTIYSMGGNEPLINNYGVYNFGGINTGYNLSYEIYNKMQDTKLTLPEGREDIPLYCNKIITEEEGLNEDQMIKLTIYLWLEGWDSDCINEMGGQIGTFHLSFANYYG